jgi:subtilisin family serine protease
MLDLRFSDFGSKASVWRAWQLLSAHGIASRVEVAVIDGGFWLDATGAPLSALAGGGSDLEMYGSYSYYQYDFDGDDYTAGGANPAKCSGGSACPWHGNNVASVAVGRANNRYGAAGTGGLVADPVLFKVDLSRSQVRRAIKTAIHWGLDVVNMSFGGSCNADCILWPDTSGFWMYVATEKGVVLVAAAGNEGVNASDRWPCAVPGVICVGALDDGTLKRIDYSNHGSRVDVYAPTNILAMPNGQSTPDLTYAGGTSASSPFVAGVAAMMKALDPALTPAQVRTILRDTAWLPEVESHVPRALNAYAAVRHVIDGQLPPDLFEENDGAGQAKTLSTGTAYENLTIVAADPDHYRFSLSGYALAEIRLQYMSDLGDMSLYLVAEDAPTAAVVEKLVKTLNEKLYYEKYLPPGSYRLAVSGKEPNLYHLTITATPHALAPDVFEPNDTLSTAASTTAGSYAVNLHHGGDVDFYAFTVPELTVVQQYQFRIPSWDVGPISMQLYRSDGTVLTAAGPWGTLTIGEAGSYIVKVSGSGSQTAYTFMHGTTLSSAMQPQFAIPVDYFWKIDPEPDPWNPVDRLLVGAAEALVVVPNDDILAMFSALDLFGADVKAALYGADGTLLSQGEAFESRLLGPGVSFSFEGMELGASYFLLVTRAEELPAEQGALLPAVQYSVLWEETAY